MSFADDWFTLCFHIWGFHPLAEYFGMATHSVPFPSISTMAYQIALFFVFEELSLFPSLQPLSIIFHNL
jgi:hypothetical protein